MCRAVGRAQSCPRCQSRDGQFLRQLGPLGGGQHLGCVGERREQALARLVGGLQLALAQRLQRLAIDRLLGERCDERLAALALEVAELAHVGERGGGDGVHAVALVVGGLDLRQHVVDLPFDEALELFAVPGLA